jgi:manganese/zinc/iron transport system permease protein
VAELIPTFDWSRVFIEPWRDEGMFNFWVVLMGFLVTAGCGLVGNYLLLRRMALIGDAISHSVLPGLVVAFLLFREASTVVMFGAAVLTGLLTVALIEFIHRQSRVKVDAAICVAFTVLFAFGVVLLSVAEISGPVHLDAECVLYGEIAFVPLEPPARLGGVELGPPAVLRMGLVTLGVLALIGIFFKELQITSFDPGLAGALGYRMAVWHYGLMGVLSIVIVSAFEAVGAILAIAMLIVPPMFAAELSDRLVLRLGWTVVHALLSAVLGFHLAVWLNCSVAGAMVVVAALLFAAVWAGKATARALPRKLRPRPSVKPSWTAASNGG